MIEYWKKVDGTDGERNVYPKVEKQRGNVNPSICQKSTSEFTCAGMP